MKLLTPTKIKFTAVIEAKDKAPLTIGVAIILEEGMSFDQVRMSTTAAKQALERRLYGDRIIRDCLLRNTTPLNKVDREERLDTIEDISGETPSALEFGE
jgi:hypothetical protein